MQRTIFMKYILSFFALVLSYGSFGQVVVTDVASCNAYTLTATVTGLTPINSGLYSDDDYSAVIPIGFTFNFYGTPNTQLVIGENGMLTFDPTLAGSYDPWPISAALLGNSSAYNSICAPWCDIESMGPPADPIMYSVQGTAPNRTFAATWCGDHMFSCTTQWTTTQIILYETTGVIEAHIGHKTVCAGWNGGYAIVGVQNASGTAATTAPGRDYPSVWTATNEAWRFTPVGTTSYTVSSIPYAPIPYASSTIYWYNSTTGAYIGTGTSITVTPTVTTTYEAAALGCLDTSKGFLTLPAVGGGSGPAPHISGLTFTNPTACGLCNGTVTLHGVTPGQIDTVFYALGGVPFPNITTTAGPDSTITITGLCGGFYNYFYIKVGNCPSNQLPATLVAPILAISHETSSNPTVCGKCDGTITLYGLTPYQPVSVTYDYNGTPHAAVTGTVAADSSFTLTGLCADAPGSYTNIAATIGACTALGTPITLTYPAPYPASFTYTLRYGCQGDTIILNNTSTPAGYNSTWTFPGAAPAIATNTATSPTVVYNDAASHVGGPFYIKLSYNSYNNPACTTADSLPVSFYHPVEASFTPNAYIICVGTPITYNPAASIPSTTPYASFAWNFGDGNTSNVETPTYTFGKGGNYIVSLIVTDTVGCQATTTASINVLSVDIHSAIHDTSVCLSIPMTLPTQTDTLGTFSSITYAWTGNPVNNLLNNTTIPDPTFWGIGDYTYTVQATITEAPVSCAATDEVTIHSYPPITITNMTTSPQTIAYGSSIQLNADGALYYYWTPDNGTLNNPNINNPIATPTDSITTYIVYGMSQYGCKNADTVIVYVDNSMNQSIPTAFTPNGDGLNDVFRMTKFTFQKLIDFRVYNRWGTLVFQTADLNKGWDGTYMGVAQDMGVYSYEIRVGLVDGTEKIYKGNVTLIR